METAGASVTLSVDRTQDHADLVLGADGVYSKTRKAIPGGDLTPFDSGKTAYRFLIPTELIAKDPSNIMKPPA